MEECEGRCKEKKKKEKCEKTEKDAEMKKEEHECCGGMCSEE